MPLFAIIFFFLLISNMSFPGTCNFIGEILIFYTVFTEFHVTFFILLIFCTTLTSLFCILIFTKIFFFQITGFLKYNLKDLNISEILIITLLSIFILFIGIYPELVLNVLI